MTLFSRLLFADMDAALESAEQKRLSQSRYWQLLLHIPKHGAISEIDDLNFFLSNDGYKSPESELNATIIALYNEVSLDDNATACRFPARRFWLENELNLNDLPKVECASFDALVKQMDPQAASLVFPFAHVNSPASMFGHTFIRIDSSYESKMLSFAINYAAGADPDKENGVLFAIKGLVGGYHGNYSLLPYYEKLKEYRDSDQRDIWEYDLDLTHDEVMQMVRHIWELKDTYSWYYFFDENCSYNMLWLIEIARPSVHLREDFYYQVIPPETVHTIVESGIVKAKHYRPSKRTTLLAYEKVLPLKGRELAVGLADGKVHASDIVTDDTIALQQKRYILEAASELNQYNLMNAKTEKDQYLARSRTILTARADLKKGETVPIREPENPVEGHQAVRATLQGGWRNRTPVGFLGLRLANHDLFDSDVGYLRGTQIEFLDTLLRYEEGKVALEKLTFLSISSIAPRSDFFTPLSWRMKSGFDTNYLDDKSDFTTTVGLGLSWGTEWSYLYLMVDPLFYYSSELIGGVGGSVGIVVYEADAFKTNIEGTHRFYTNGYEQWLFSVSQNIRLGSNVALKASYDYVQKDASVKQGEYNTFKMSLDYFF